MDFSFKNSNNNLIIKWGDKKLTPIDEICDSPFCMISRFFVQKFGPEYVSFLKEAVDFHGIDVSKVIVKSCDDYPSSVTPHFYDDGFPRSLELNFRKIDCSNFADFKYIALHELRHIFQFITGMLKRCGRFTFLYNDKICQAYDENVVAHAALPHEIDANEFVLNSPLFEDDIVNPSLKIIIDETKRLMELKNDK